MLMLMAFTQITVDGDRHIWDLTTTLRSRTPQRRPDVADTSWALGTLPCLPATAREVEFREANVPISTGQ